ncbi:Retrovirus-related Pol polyprotein from transposon 17.6, partial [Mucuna pruriens]
MKLLAIGIIYPISDIQNSWRVCINYRKLNQATCKDHFPLPFIDQVLERLVICRFILHQQINIRPPSPARLAPLLTLGCHLACATPQAPSKENCMEVFMDDFTVYDPSFDAYLCIETNLVLNFEKCHFMVTEGIVLGHLVSNRGIEVDKAKIDIISSLSHLASMWKACSFLRHVDFYKRLIQNFSIIALPFPSFYNRMWTLSTSWKAFHLEVPIEEATRRCGIEIIKMDEEEAPLNNYKSDIPRAAARAMPAPQVFFLSALQQSLIVSALSIIPAPVSSRSCFTSAGSSTEASTTSMAELSGEGTRSFSSVAFSVRGLNTASLHSSSTSGAYSRAAAGNIASKLPDTMYLSSHSKKAFDLGLLEQIKGNPEIEIETNITFKSQTS